MTTDTDTFNKNEKQVYFNQVKGTIFQIQEGDRFCNIILEVGHESLRYVCLTMKRAQYDLLIKEHKLGDKVGARFYVTSKNKEERWYTTIQLLEMHKC